MWAPYECKLIGNFLRQSNGNYFLNFIPSNFNEMFLLEVGDAAVPGVVDLGDQLRPNCIVQGVQVRGGKCCNLQPDTWSRFLLDGLVATGLWDFWFPYVPYIKWNYISELIRLLPWCAGAHDNMYVCLKANKRYIYLSIYSRPNLPAGILFPPLFNTPPFKLDMDMQEKLHPEVPCALFFLVRSRSFFMPILAFRSLKIMYIFMAKKS